MKKFINKVICLWLSITLSGCGAAYQVDSIIRTDQNMAVTWKESKSKMCRGEGNPFNFCEENEYINPYTYNPEFADPNSDPNSDLNSATNSESYSGSNSGPKKKNTLLAGKKSLYQLASASAVSLEITFGDISNPCGMAKTIANRSNRLSDYLYKRYSSAHKGATLSCENTSPKEVDRVAKELFAFLNAQLMSGNLYIEAGLGTDTTPIVTTSTVITEAIFNNPCNLAERITKRDNKLGSSRKSVRGSRHG